MPDASWFQKARSDPYSDEIVQPGEHLLFRLRDVSVDGRLRGAVYRGSEGRRFARGKSSFVTRLTVAPGTRAGNLLCLWS